MAKVIIVPEAADTRNQVHMLIALNKAAGAAVIISQCLHARKEGVEDGSDEGTVRCLDCGATAGKPGTDECPHGADGRTCGEGCPCVNCHGAKSGACCDHPGRDTCDDSCPSPTSEVATHLCCNTCPDPCPMAAKEQS